MTIHLAELVEPRPSHYQRRLTLAALAGVTVVLVLLWLIDPRQLNMPLCSFHALTGYHCPGCGGTRAMHDLLHGRLLSALHHHALATLVAPLALYTFVSEVVRLVRGRPLPGDLMRNPWTYAVLGTLLVCFGLLRNVPVYPLTLLAPPG